MDTTGNDEVSPSFINKVKKYLFDIDQRGIDTINDLMPKCWVHADVYSERVKATLLCICAFSSLMMFTSPSGFLYACFPRPVSAFPLLYWNTILQSSFPTPEYGMHFITLIVYSLAFYFGVVLMERQGINKPFHKLGYMFFLFILTFYTPFEWIYITLYDVFHNIPVYGYPVIWCFGWWKDTLGFIFESVIGIDGGLTIMSILGMYYIRKDLGDYVSTEFRINKKSVILFSLFLITMFLWAIIPVHTEVEGYGTKWFPQTIYVHYGYFEDYNLPIPNNGDIYGIVEEYYHPNDVIKYHNHVAKIFSVAFMFYTFVPRVIKFEDSDKK